MGTRCNIVLKCGDHVEYMYRHYDGYPDSVLPELDKYAKAIRWYGDNRKATHPSQWVEHCFADTAKTLAFYTDLFYEKSKRVSTYFYKQIVRDAVTA